MNTATNLQDDLIMLSEGTYSTPAAGFLYKQIQSNDIESSGGWTEFFANTGGLYVGVNGAKIS